VVVAKSPEVVAAVKNRDQFHGRGKRRRNLYHKLRHTPLAFDESAAGRCDIIRDSAKNGTVTSGSP